MRPHAAPGQLPQTPADALLPGLLVVWAQGEQRAPWVLAAQVLLLVHPQGSGKGSGDHGLLRYSQGC
jgi:hypothetical protein